MNSKTPKFDEALDKIISGLGPHFKNCDECTTNFEIFQEDIEFYRKLRIPPPKICPDCRMQRRFGFYNNILKFYKKECFAHPEEKVISTFFPESHYKIFDLNYWWSDKWGGEDYKVDYNPNNNFLDQFQELSLKVPHPAITHYWKGVVNSPYTISAISTKNCYFSSVTGSIENVHYSYWAIESKDSLDLLNTDGSENCYESVQCHKCYNCKFCRLCVECLDSSFMLDCKNCSNCFGCFNLRNKQYYFLNEKLSKEEYLKKISEINLGDRNILNEYKDRFKEFSKQAIRKPLISNDSKNINCTGDSIRLGKNCYWVFRGWNLENLRYCQDVALAKDSMDVYLVGPNIELSYEITEAVNCSNVKFSYFIKNGLNLEYCLECHDCKNCFGCVGLRSKNFYILNRAYTEIEYWDKIDEIKTKMLEKEEYGQFFPLTKALHAYNDTYAMIEFPLSKEEVEQRGWQWHETDNKIDTQNIQLIYTKDIPVDIKDVQDDILEKAIICEVSGKPFRIIKAELDFYRKNNLPIPTRHPYERMVERLKNRNPSKLWKSNCQKCQKDIFTSYSPDKQKVFKIYCESCYNAEVV
ncbi:MAG: hypothetical protein WC705_00700 [Candidatus Paceibacterota bacterium]|jgi:hypothetical protein